MGLTDFLFFGGYGGAIDMIFSRVTKGEKTKIFTPNAQMLSAARRDKRLYDLLLCAELPFPDGILVHLGSKMLGHAPRERTNGIDLAERILKEAAKRGMRIFLLGGRRGVAEDAAKKLSKRFEGLIISGTHHGYFDKHGTENDEIIAKIELSDADILFVCLGFPTQERWIADNIHKLKAIKIAAGLGGSLDVWSDRIGRAPVFVRKIGAEWLWRMAKEPSRIKRLPGLFAFIGHAMREKRLKSAKAKSNLLQNR